MTIEDEQATAQTEMTRVQRAVESETWLILPEALDTIRTIAARANDPDLISRYRSEPADRNGIVEILGSTAIVSINGPMMRYANLFTYYSGATSTEMIAQAIAAVPAMGASSAVIRFDTPGGQANGIDQLGSLIDTLGMPTTAFITGHCCSAGYWLASQCDQIVIAPLGVAGCIGAKGQAPGKADENVMVSRRSPGKLGSRESTQRLLDDFEEVFLEAVASGRGVDVETVVERFGQGDVFIGRKAVEAGLADAVGTLDQILASAVAGTSPAPDAITLSSTKGTTMSDDSKTAGIAQADHEKAVEAARTSGYDAGFTAGQEKGLAEKDEAVTADRVRIGAILDAGTATPTLARKLAMKGMSLEDATDILADATPEKTGVSLDERMDGSNPRISGDAPESDGEDDADTEASWDQAFAKGGN